MKTPSPLIPNKLLTVREVAEITSLSKWTINKLLADNKIARIKLGHRICVHPQELARYIAEGAARGRRKRGGTSASTAARAAMIKARGLLALRALRARRKGGKRA